jgi:hypothetical protein
LFFTGSKHAGENIAHVLKQRAEELPAPIQMCDALSRNMPKLAGVKILLVHCLSHGRRQIVEVAENFPQECEYVLETLGSVYHNDALVREQELSAEERLRFHQEHSGPLLKKLKEWMKAQVGGAQDRAELRARQSHLVSAETLGEADTFSFAARGAARQQHCGARPEEGDPESPKRTVLQNAERCSNRRSVYESDPHL